MASFSQHEITFSFKSVPPETLKSQVMIHSYGCLGGITSSRPETVQDIIESSAPSQPLLVSTQDEDFVGQIVPHGLISTIIQAYSSHIPLQLRPDDIWLAITSAFGLFVAQNDALMRPHLVAHEGRKELVLKRGGDLSDYNTPESWEPLIQEMVHLIRDNSDPALAEWVVPNFSTTTPMDRLISNLTLMTATKNFFAEKWQFCCGLSKVTLDGSKADWNNILKRLDYLRSFDVPQLTQWADVLAMVLARFVDAYQGKVEEKWWQRICTSEKRGSGCEKTYRGWMFAFSPFNEKGEYILNTMEEILATHIYAVVDDNEIVSCMNEVNAYVEGSGPQVSLRFVAGIAGASYNKQTGTLSPSSAWGIIQLPKPEDELV